MKKLLLAGAALLVVGAVYAAQIITTPLPFTFVTGTVADPTQVNANFNAIVNGVNNNAQSSKSPNSVVSWAYFDVANTTGPVTLASSYNVASISYNASNHIYTVTFTNGLNNGSYIVTYGPQCLSISPADVFGQAVTESTATSGFTFAYAGMNPASNANVTLDCYPGNSFLGTFLVTGGY